MKIFFLFFTLILSLSASGQSMIVLKNGKILTIDQEGILLDLSSFMIPAQIKSIGGRYLIDEKNKLHTVNVNGEFISKEQDESVATNVKFFAENYFISKFGTLYTIDDSGYISDLGKEREFRNVRAQGGVFLVVEKKVELEKRLVFLIVTTSGVLQEVSVPNLNMNSINYLGNRYFTTTRGELFTVSTEGYVYSKKDMGQFNGWQLRRGGNYFFLENALYTVSQNGMLMSGGSGFESFRIKYMGTNFFITIEGMVYTISSTGAVRTVPLGYSLSDISHFSHL